MSDRDRGVSNYNNELLLEVIKMLKPVSTSDWQRVATRYAELKSDSIVRDGATIKRHFHEKMCNKGLKPTGSAATDKRGQAIREAQKVLHAIMESVSTGIYGGKSKHEKKQCLRFRAPHPLLLKKAMIAIRMMTTMMDTTKLPRNMTLTAAVNRKTPRKNLRFAKPRFVKPGEKRMGGGSKHTPGSASQTCLKNLGDSDGVSQTCIF